MSVFPRTLVRRGGVKKLRVRDRIPAVVYGRHNPAQSLELNLQEFEKLLHQSASENILVDMTVEGDTRTRRLALVQEVQHHALSGRILHVDFHEVAENERVSIMVPVEAVGEAAGVKEGGILEHVLFRVKIRALPHDLPEIIHVDVSHLLVGQAVHLGELQLPPNVEILGDKKTTVIAVAAPMTEAQEAAVEATATEGTLEPEVIKEKKEEGATAGAEPAKPGEKPAKPGEKPVEKGGEKKEKAAETKEKGAEKKAEKKK